MKNFWSDFFYDIDECGQTREQAVGEAGLIIAKDLIEAQQAIENLEPKKAIELIREIRKYL